LNSKNGERVYPEGFRFSENYLAPYNFKKAIKIIRKLETDNNG